MINDDVFARMVSEDVKNKLSSVQKQLLLQPENWERWKEGLLLLIENLDIQIESIKDDADADGDADADSDGDDTSSDNENECENEDTTSSDDDNDNESDNGSDGSSELTSEEYEYSDDE